MSAPDDITDTTGRDPRILEGIAYQPPAWGRSLAHGQLVDTDGHEIGPGCIDPVVIPNRPAYVVSVNHGDLCVVVVSGCAS